jgi:orotidine-5'-phosphate decarboxylase
MNHNPIIIALDFPNAGQARDLIGHLDGAVKFYKVGMELYAAEGMHFVRELIAADKQVFLDLKLYDIGETVKRATACIAETNVRFLTVHGSNAVMRAAVEGCGASTLQLLAVTVLTSFDQEDLADLGYECPIADLVALRVRNALAAGINGLVCSARDAAAVRQIAGSKAIVVTPGVRSETAPTGDQKRVATPAEAVQAGADYVVIGREVTRAKDPKAEVQRILKEIGSVPFVHYPPVEHRH